MKISLFMMLGISILYSSSCFAEIVCINGNCHNVFDLGGGNVTVDGQLHSIQRNGSTTTIDNHIYQDYGGGIYSRDGQMHLNQDLGGGFYLHDGELNSIQRY
jgi:hypothetical protein